MTIEVVRDASAAARTIVTPQRAGVMPAIRAARPDRALPSHPYRIKENDMSHVDGLLADEQSIGVLPERVQRDTPRRRRRARRSARTRNAHRLVRAVEQARVSGMLDDDALDDYVHAAHLELAAAINYDGVAAQVAFLIAQHGCAGVTEILSDVGVPLMVEANLDGARPVRRARARVLTRRQLRRAKKKGTRATEWVRQNGRTYANLVEADGRPRTVQVISPRRRPKDGRR